MIRQSLMARHFRNKNGPQFAKKPVWSPSPAFFVWIVWINLHPEIPHSQLINQKNVEKISKMMQNNFNTIGIPDGTQ